MLIKNSIKHPLMLFLLIRTIDNNASYVISHNVVQSCARRSAAEIERLKKESTTQQGTTQG